MPSICAALVSPRVFRTIVSLLAIAVFLPVMHGAQAAVDPGITRQIARAGVPFVPNAGQWDKQAAFAAQTFAGTLFVTTEGMLVYSLPGTLVPETAQLAGRAPGWVVTETFVGADRQPRKVTPQGLRPGSAQVSYFIGNDASRHQRALDSFERIDLGEVFHGINVQLRATGTNVEKIFTVAPRHDPRQIQLRLGGAARLELGPQGELIAHTGNGPITYTAPIAFQDDAQGARHAIAVRYALNGTDQSYRFLVGDYDHSLPLVIDPLLQSTYLGAGGIDQTAALVIHPATGEVYVAGHTTSPTSTFPGVSGGAQGSLGGGTFDVFVSRFSADLTTLVNSSYLGAAGVDFASALAIHPATGDVYVAGRTSSLTNTFPGVSGGAQGSYGGGSTDAFISRFSADLTTLLKSTYLGAAGTEQLGAMAIHPATGDVYVAGQTDSATSTFPGVSGGAQGSLGGGTDAFVSRFSSDLIVLHKSGYLGAAGSEQATALAIHPATGDVYVAGHTNSTTNTFPGVSGGAQGSSGGGFDVFISRFSADLTSLAKSSYLGDVGDDLATALAIHPATGDVYVAGQTNSTTSTFPGVGGGAQGTTGGGNDAFVSRFSADLVTLIKSSYLGAAGSDHVDALAIHPTTGEVYVAGETNSTTNTFPGVGGGAQGNSGGGIDAFVSRFSADLVTLIKSSYLGTAGSEHLAALAIHPATGEVYVAGDTSSTTNTFPGVGGGAQGSTGGGTDVFVSRFSLDLLAADVYPNAFKFIAQSNVPGNVLRTSAPVQVSGLGAIANVSVSGALGSAFCISTANNCSCNATPGGVFTTVAATMADGQFICARHVSAPIPNALRESIAIVGGGTAKFQTFTGTNLSSCSLDVDGNGSKDPLTDGLIILRALFGLTGTAVTSNAIGAGAQRNTWALIQPFLNDNCGTAFAP